ncbi:MAG: psd [Parachlamydiales bacterium]|nr:psd [Parachlamydiales bacterium]
MKDIQYVDRSTQQVCTEEVYGRWALSLLYGRSFAARLFAFVFLPIFSRVPVISRFYGYLQTRQRSRKKIVPFIQEYKINTAEFADPVESFHSFNDFFIRKLKPEKRPIDLGSAVAPADGRYLVVPRIGLPDAFYVKGQRFDLLSFLQDSRLAQQYCDGSMVIARLNPTDYHRFHFPVTGLLKTFRKIPGPLFSVNPWALAKRFSILWENKRALSLIQSEMFGDVLMAEIGATCVGSIHQTHSPNARVGKGEEKGYFSFGGSSVILLFEQNRIVFEDDLIRHSSRHLETKCLMGQPLGRSRE